MRLDISLSLCLNSIFIAFSVCLRVSLRVSVCLSESLPVSLRVSMRCMYGGWGRYVSLRGCPAWAVEGALAAALEALRAQLGPQETEVVVVTGVGGTDDKTNTHKHASHTKGGTVDSAALEALTSGAASKLLATRYNLTALLGICHLRCSNSWKRNDWNDLNGDENLMCVCVCDRRVTPLFTVDHKGSRQQDGSQKKYFGSYLIKLRK